MMGEEEWDEGRKGEGEKEFEGEKYIILQH